MQDIYTFLFKSVQLSKHFISFGSLFQSIDELFAKDFFIELVFGRTTAKLLLKLSIKKNLDGSSLSVTINST